MNEQFPPKTEQAPDLNTVEGIVEVLKEIDEKLWKRAGIFSGKNIYIDKVWENAETEKRARIVPPRKEGEQVIVEAGYQEIKNSKKQTVLLYPNSPEIQALRILGK